MFCFLSFNFSLFLINLCRHHSNLWTSKVEKDIDLLLCGIPERNQEALPTCLYLQSNTSAHVITNSSVHRMHFFSALHAEKKQTKKHTSLQIWDLQSSWEDYKWRITVSHVSQQLCAVQYTEKLAFCGAQWDMKMTYDFRFQKSRVLWIILYTLNIDI